MTVSTLHYEIHNYIPEFQSDLISIYCLHSIWHLALTDDINTRVVSAHPPEFGKGVQNAHKPH